MPKTPKTPGDDEFWSLPHKERFGRALRPVAQGYNADTLTGMPDDAPHSTDTISGTPEELERKSRGPFSGI